MARATSNVVLPGLLNSSQGPNIAASPRNLAIAQGTSFNDSGQTLSSTSPLAHTIGGSVPVASQSPSAGLLAHALSNVSTPVSSVTHTAPDGTTVKVDTHKPVAPEGSNSQQGATQNQASGQQNQSSSTQTPIPGNPGLIAALQGQQAAQKEAADLGVQKANDVAAAGSVPGTLAPFAQAQQGQVQNVYNARINALGNLANSYNSTISANTPIAGPGGVLVSPTTGQPISGANSAFQGGVAQGQVALGSQVANMQAANVAAKGIQNSVVSYLQQNPQLNPTDATFANAISQWVSGKQLGDPKYQTLANYLNEYISTLAPILGVGGDTTNLKTQIAQSMINAQASGQSIAEVLNNIGTLADQKVQNLASGAQGGGVVSGNPGGQMFGSFF